MGLNGHWLEYYPGDFKHGWQLQITKLNVGLYYSWESRTMEILHDSTIYKNSLFNVTKPRCHCFSATKKTFVGKIMNNPAFFVHNTYTIGFSGWYTYVFFEMFPLWNMVTSHHNNMPVQRRQAPDAVPAHTSTFDPWRHSLIPNVFCM